MTRTAPGPVDPPARSRGRRTAWALPALAALLVAAGLVGVALSWGPMPSPALIAAEAALALSFVLLAGWAATGFRRALRDRDRTQEILGEVFRSRQHLAAILDGVTDGITVQDESGRLLFANSAAARLVGLASAEEMLTTTPGAIVERFEILDEEGRPFPVDRLPGRLAMRGEETPGVTLRYRERATGSERWAFVRAALIPEDRDHPRMVVNSFQDITEERWARRSSRVLAEIGQDLLAASLDYEGTLHLLAELVVPRLADVATVYLADERGTRRVRVVHADPQMQVRMQDVSPETTFEAPEGHPVKQVLDTGAPQLIPEISETAIERWVRPEHREAVREMQLGSAMIVPLTARGTRLGAIALVTVGNRRRYEEQDLELATDLAARAALAMENARLHRDEQAARQRAESEASWMRRLQRVSATLAASTTVGEVAAGVLAQGIDAVAAASGAVATIDGDGRTIRLVETQGFSEEERARWSSFSLDAPVPLSEAVRSGSPVYIGSPEALADAWPHLVGPSPSGGSQAWAALPLTREGDAIGAIALTFAEPRAFDAEERRFLEILAQEAAQALERARLYESERAARGEAVRQQERLNFLAEASEVLAGSLREERTLQHLVELIVPRLADWCIVDVVGTDGVIEQLAVAHEEPKKGELIRDLRRRYPPDLRDHPIPRVIASGSSEMAGELSDEDADIQDEGHRELLRELGATSHMVVPLTARGRTLGAVSFISGHSGRRYAGYDLALAEDLARRAALALDNARLYRDRSRIARSLQQSLLPATLPRVDGAEVAARYRPAGEGSEIGGDFYDLFEVSPRRWGVVIGDVAGKGPEAAALTALTRYTVRTAWLDQGKEPIDILRILNDAVLRDGGDRLCTVAVGLLDLSSGAPTLTVATGGHPAPVVLHPDGSVEAVPVAGTLLGAFPAPELAQATVRLGPGDLVLCYTDGLIDPGRASHVPQDDRLAEFLRLCLGLDAELACRRLERHIGTFTSGEAEDDAALLVLRLAPER